MHGVTKRCPLSWLTESALEYEPSPNALAACAGSQALSQCVPAVHMDPK
jgi:hypothetical protein